MIDTLEVPVFLYGVLYDQDSIATKRECDDGTTYIRDEYLRYEDDVKAYNKKYETYTETYNKIKEKREAELRSQTDSCINQQEIKNDSTPDWRR